MANPPRLPPRPPLPSAAPTAETATRPALPMDRPSVAVPRPAAPARDRRGPEFRIFYAHRLARTHDDQAAIRLQVAELQGFADGKLPDNVPRVVAGMDDWQMRFRGQAGGNYPRWSELVGAGHRADGEPYYHAIVAPVPPLVPDLVIGSATAQILWHGKRNNRALFVWDGTRLHALDRLEALKGGPARTAQLVYTPKG